MGVTITPLATVAGEVSAWVCRSGPEHHRIPDYYTTSCVIARKRGWVAEIEALSGPQLTIAEVSELGRLLRQEGITRMQWDRIRKNGEIHTARVRT